MICSFCMKHQNEIAVIIVGPGVNICDECVFICFDIIKERFYSSEKLVDEHEKLVEAHENIIRNMEVGIEVEK